MVEHCQNQIINHHFSLRFLDFFEDDEELGDEEEGELEDDVLDEDEDTDCYSLGNIESLRMTRQKSKTDYSKRPSYLMTRQFRKDSRVSAIQEADDVAEMESTHHSGGILPS